MSRRLYSEVILNILIESIKSMLKETLDYIIGLIDNFVSLQRSGETHNKTSGEVC